MNFASVSRVADDILRLKPFPYLGVDFEWDVRDNVPTILGVSDGTLTVSVVQYAVCERDFHPTWHRIWWHEENGLHYFPYPVPWEPLVRRIAHDPCKAAMRQGGHAARRPCGKAVLALGSEGIKTGIKLGRRLLAKGAEERNDSSS